MNYVRIYEELITNARHRGIAGYVERHHIVPKAHGGNNTPNNLVALTAREHFLAHWLLVKVYNSPAMARAFRLLTDTNHKRRGRDYEHAKTTYAKSMYGENNVAKRPEVRAKISSKLSANHPYTGTKRPEHAQLLRDRGYWAGENSLWYGQGERQLGAKNHMARAVVGCKDGNIAEWSTLQYAAKHIGVTLQAVCQAIKKNQRSKGWTLEYKK